MHSAGRLFVPVGHNRRSCVDSQLPSGGAWVDNSGAYGCNDYEANGWCTDYGNCCANGGLTPSQSCCACGGGSALTPTSTVTPTSTFICTVGQHISAVWSGDGNYHGAVVVSIAEDTRLITVNWDDGSTSYLDVAFSEAKDDIGTACLSLSSECGIHVSSSRGVESVSCGESTDSACKSIQKGIERAGDYNTVCVHKGIYQCETGWAGRITQSMMLLGFDAVVDCNGAGGSFQISGVEQVVISGFTIRDAVGESWNNGYAGGVDVINTKNVSVAQCTFTNCSGREAGAIAVHSQTSYGSSNVRTFQDLTISHCHGGVSNPRRGGSAGSVSVSYHSAFTTVAPPINHMSTRFRT